MSHQGLAPEDAPETRALAKFIDALATSKAGAKLFIDWHAYSQVFLFRKYPNWSEVPLAKAIYTAYGYDCFKIAADDHELRMLASNFTSVVRKVYGTPFTSGPACSTLYAVSGCSDDYTYDVSYVYYFHFVLSFDTDLIYAAKSSTLLPLSFEILAPMASFCLLARFVHPVRRFGQASNIYWKTSIDAIPPYKRIYQ